MQDSTPTTEMTLAPYGSWSSPFSSDLVTAGSVSLSQTRLDGESVYWVEGRPLDGGRQVLVRRDPDGSTHELTSPEHYVRTRAHEYGGGSYIARDGVVWFTNYSDQLIYRRGAQGETRCVIPDGDTSGESTRFADLHVTPDGSRIICIRETHGRGDEPTHDIVSFPVDGGETPTTIAAGRSFYSSPRVSPDGESIAWITWDHPCMPWDGSELWIARLLPDGGTEDARRIAGGDSESIFQPEWSPRGELHFVSDRSGWWNLHVLRDGEVVPLMPMEAEFGAPQWVFGMSRYAWLTEDRIACVYSDGSEQRLGVLQSGSGELAPVDVPYTSFGETLRGDGEGRLVFVGSSPTRFSEVVLLDVDAGTTKVCRQSIELEVDPLSISVARAIEFPTTQDRTAHAFFYAPASRDHRAPDDERPPLIVFSHGGPTGQTSGDLRLGIQYWTSRGFSVVDVNYGGSSGYGREYRERLRGTWGIVDTDDCINAVRHLDSQGLIDPERTAIRGGSAGGYTTLCALTFHDVFAAGASYYGVADLEALVRDTHKFESRYLDGLIGPYPERSDLYHERSPIHHTEKLSCPVILLQGLEDRVVPPSQAETMVEALDGKGLPYAYLTFEGEQHGFRKAESRKRALRSELTFYARVFGFELGDEAEPLRIENLD